MKEGEGISQRARVCGWPIDTNNAVVMARGKGVGGWVEMGGGWRGREMGTPVIVPTIKIKLEKSLYPLIVTPHYPSPIFKLSCLPF